MGSACPRSERFARMDLTDGLDNGEVIEATARADAKSIPYESAKQLPVASGVYWVLSSEQVLYVGQTINLRARLNNHHHWVDFRDRSADTIRWISTAPDQLQATEAQLIAELKPELNARRRPKPVRSARFTSGGLIKASVILHVDQLTRLERFARERHVSKSVIIRAALDEKLASMEHGASLIEARTECTEKAG